MKLPLFPDLQHRCRRPELMDQPDLDETLHRQALRGLEWANFVSRSASILWPQIQQLVREVGSRPVRVLDVACGGGDVAIALWRKAARRRLDLRIDGCDISPVAVTYAQQRAEQKRASVEFYEQDALGPSLPTGYDVLTCSLFLHHLDEGDALRLLSRMAEAAGRLVLVNDLVRSRWGYLLVYAGTRLVSRSRIVHVDGPLSVAGAFTPAEALQLAERAGMSGAALSQHWPQRFLLAWSKR